MDRDRIAGAAKEIKGSVKEAVGKAVGDAKLQADGKADKIEGKVQNAVGSLKDAIRRSWHAVLVSDLDLSTKRRRSLTRLSRTDNRCSDPRPCGRI